jgi:large repetitive protein
VSFIDANTGWIVGDSGKVLGTSDGGATWNALVSGTSSSLRGVSFPDLLNGWAIGDSGTIIHTADGGNSWASQNGGASERLRGIVAIGTFPQVVDEAPTITLSGAEPFDVECGVAYVDPGPTAIDDLDGDISVSIVVDSSNVDTGALGSYSVTYDVIDSGGNAAVQLTRTVNVVDTTPPTLTLLSDDPQVIECPSPYVELGADASDTHDLALGAIVIDASAVDTTVPGIYPVTYDISDASGNAALTVIRSVEVVDTTAPVIALVGDNPQVLECPDPYLELGATATDTCDQALGSIVIDTSAVDASTPGSYVVTYNISDASGNEALTVSRVVDVIDSTPPVITLLGDNPQLIECPSPYVELGATASDTCDPALGAVVIDASAVDATTPGDYVVTYNISDASGNAAVPLTRTVTVRDTTPPVIVLLGDNPQLIECPSPYSELGATASDTCDLALGAVVIDASAVDATTPGDYVVTYNISDASGNAATQLTRTVTVRDTTPPVIVLLGDNPQLIECPSPYTELGATASDTCDLALGAVVIDVSAVDATTPGDYVVTYNISDASGNAATQLTRTVTVRDTPPPVIVLLGDNPQLIECPSPYTELGATASDTCDLALGAVVIDASAVDATTPGDYVVTYNVSDASGNAATQLTRTVTVRDTTPPVIVLLGDNPQLIECPSPYVELGATASDSCDLALGAVVIDASAIDATIPGDYVVTYNISDASGNAAAQITRTVRVQDTTPPVITLTGLAALTLECSVDSYSEEGATVSDSCDTTVTVSVGGDTVDPTHVGTYVVTYDSTDASGNAAIQLTRTVTVVDTTAPVITLLGYNPETIECPDPYQEEGATATDLCDGDLTAEIVIDSSEVNSTVPGTYEVSYTVEDAAGNSTTEVREVEVVDTTVPIISLSGDSNVVLLQGDTYLEEGATVTDSCDQSVSVVIGGDVVDSSIIGVYVVTYDSTDSSGNVATQVIRAVTILPRFAALSALFGCADLKAEQDSLVNGSVGSTQSVDLHSQSEVTGDVVNVTGKVDVKSKAVVGGNIDAGGQVTVAKDASVGSSVISGGKIDLKKNASIGGDATSGGQVKLANGASVAGVITENAGVLPLTDIPLPVLALTTSGSNVSVKKNKSATLLPGAYKKLSGKEASTISLSSGHYTFSEIDVNKNSVIELDVSAGPITVDVVGKVDFDGIEMMLIGGGGGGAMCCSRFKAILSNLERPTPETAEVARAVKAGAAKEQVIAIRSVATSGPIWLPMLK